MNSKNKRQQTVVNHIYGFQLNGCQITNLTFQTNTTSERLDDTENDSREGNVQSEDSSILKPLCTTEVQEILRRLQSNGILDNHWQTINLSNAERGVLASLLANRLNIGNLWKIFGDLWHIKPETLRSAYNKGMEQKLTQNFIKRIKQLLAE